jgi:hypothetical protein
MRNQTWAASAVATKTTFLLLDLSSQRAWTGSDGAENPDDMNQLDVGDKGMVLVVSDGMGGALAGDVASRMAIESVREVMIGDDGEGCEPMPPGRLPQARNAPGKSRDSL